MSQTDEQALGPFALHLPACSCFKGKQSARSHGVAGAHLFLTYLREQGVVPSEAKSVADERPEIIRQFEHWM